MKHVDVINKNNIKNIILIHPKFKNIFAKIFFITLLITYLEIIYFYNSPGFEFFKYIKLIFFKYFLII
jgi:hypothetical protein